MHVGGIVEVVHFARDFKGAVCAHVRQWCQALGRGGLRQAGDAVLEDPLVTRHLG